MQNNKKTNIKNNENTLIDDEATLQIIEKTLDHFLKINGDIKEIYSSVCECAVNFKKLIKDSGYIQFLKQKYNKKSYQTEPADKSKVVN